MSLAEKSGFVDRSLLFGWEHGWELYEATAANSREAYIGVPQIARRAVFFAMNARKPDFEVDVSQAVLGVVGRLDSEVGAVALEVNEIEILSASRSADFDVTAIHISKAKLGFHDIGIRKDA